MNVHLVVPAIAWLVAQVSKLVVQAAKGNADWRYLYKSGGMPSSHTATVIGLLVTSLIVDGAGSNIFGVSAILALIVVYDSLNVRRAVGEHREVLREMIIGVPKGSHRLSQVSLYETLGHRPEEVLVGALIGILTPAVVLFERWNDTLEFLTEPMTRAQLISMLVICSLLIVGGFAARSVYRRRDVRRLPVARSIRRIVNWTVIVPALLGAALAALNLNNGIDTIWFATILAWLLAGTLVAYFLLFRSVGERLAAEAQTAALNRQRKKIITKRKKQRRKR